MLSIKKFFKKRKTKKELEKIYNDIGIDINAIQIINTEEDFYKYIKLMKIGKIKPFSILSNIRSEEAKKLLNKKEIILEAVKYFGNDLSLASEALRGDPMVVETAATTTPGAIAFAINPSVSTLKKIAIKSLENFVSISIYFPEKIIEIQKDIKLRSIFLEYLKQRPYLIKYFPNYQSDMEFLEVALENNHSYIQYAGKDIPNHIIIKELKEIKILFLKEITENIKDNVNIEYIKTKYSKFVMYINEIVLNIKKNFPQRFESLEFIYELVKIEPKLIRIVELKEIIENEELIKLSNDYIDGLPREINNIISNKH